MSNKMLDESTDMLVEKSGYTHPGSLSAQNVQDTWPGREENDNFHLIY